jgi:hypothetical protein
MSTPQTMADLISKNGWPRINYDQLVWIPVMPTFPEGYDRDSFCAEIAELWWARSGLPYAAQDVLRLRHVLAEFQQGVYGKIPCHLAFLHLPDPRLIPLMLYVSVWEADGDRDRQLRMWCHADDQAAVEPPIVEEFTTGNLGTGIRVLRYRHLEDGALYAGLSYAWRSEEFQADLLISTVSEDLGRLHRAMPDIEDFARAATIIPRPDVCGT